MSVLRFFLSKATTEAGTELLAESASAAAGSLRETNAAEAGPTTCRGG